MSVEAAVFVEGFRYKDYDLRITEWLRTAWESKRMTLDWIWPWDVIMSFFMHPCWNRWMSRWSLGVPFGSRTCAMILREHENWPLEMPPLLPFLESSIRKVVMCNQFDPRAKLIILWSEKINQCISSYLAHLMPLFTLLASSQISNLVGVRVDR